MSHHFFLCLHYFLLFLLLVYHFFYCITLNDGYKDLLNTEKTKQLFHFFFLLVNFFHVILYLSLRSLSLSLSFFVTVFIRLNEVS